MSVEREEIESRKRLFESELEEWERSGDVDCLAAWVNYLSWLEDRGLNRHNSYKEAIQKCLKYFASESDFFGDIRLAKIYVQAADICKDPVTVYKYMQTNDIGTKFALYYRAHSNALLEGGSRNEAIRMLERGIQQKARPIQMLQKRLQELKNVDKGQGPTQKRGAGGGKSDIPIAMWDEKSERSEAFYSQPGLKYCYQKQLVYPPSGGDFSLEQIRASLPQYRPSPQDESGECDMEMTVAVTGNITMHIPVVPNLFKSGQALAESRPVLSRKNSAGIVKKDENEDKPLRDNISMKGRKPLGLLSAPHSDPEPSIRSITCPEDELELLIAEKDQTPLELSRNLEKSPLSHRKKRISDEDIEQQLEQLVLEKDQQLLGTVETVPGSLQSTGINNSQRNVQHDQLTVRRDEEQRVGFASGLFGREGQSFVKVHEPNMSVGAQREKENMSLLTDKENRMQSWMETKGQGFNFTPNTVDGGVYVPSAPVGGVSLLKTRLNFSEADSMMSMHQESGLVGPGRENLSMSTSRRGAGSTSIAMFNTTLDCEKRAKLTDEQLMVENEFAMTGFHDGPLSSQPGSESGYQPPSLVNGTSPSFDIFHDSWNVSKTNTSQAMGQNRSAFMKPATGAKLGNSLAEKRKPLQSLPVAGGQRPLQMLTNPQEPSFDEYSLNNYSQSACHSYQPSQTAESFSVFEEDQSSLAPYHDSWADNSRHISAVQHRSMNRGQGGVSVNHSVNKIKAQAMTSQAGIEGQRRAEKSNTGTYRALVGAPVMNVERERVNVTNVDGERVNVMNVDGERVNEMNHTMEQSFTQFDIPHPKMTAPSSTPAGRRLMNFTLDLSVIPPNEPTTHDINPRGAHSQKHPFPIAELDSNPPQLVNRELEKEQGYKNSHIGHTPHPIPHHVSKGTHEKFPDLHPQFHTEHAQFSSHPPPMLASGKAAGMSMAPGEVVNLSTITEESENYKNSTCSSRFTVSSGSSRFSTSSASSHSTSTLLGSSLEEINPFQPHIINMMLNKVGIPLEKMESLNETFPKIRNGSDLVLGREEFQSMKLLAEGGFAKVYVGVQGQTKKALKVQSPPLEWEVAVIDQLHSRLVSSNLHKSVSSFIEIEKAFRLDNTSVIVSEYHPFGSLLDLVNVNRLKSRGISASVLLYLTREIISTVATLHQCGIIHADIKPDNFMIRDFRQFQDASSSQGCGLCLVDFGRAIDLHVFHDDVTFVGSCETDGFQCTQMVEGKPWKWQVDYFGVAACVFALLSNNYMDIVKSPDTGLYKPTASISRKYRSVMWTQLFDLLLNSSEALPLAELIQPFQSQLLEICTPKFCSELTKSFNELLTHRQQQQLK